MSRIKNYRKRTSLTTSNSKCSLVYPRIPRDERKSVKIPLVEHINIKFLKNGDWTYQEIADKYNVTIYTIYCIVNPDWYEKRKKYSAKLKSYQWRNDADYRKYVYKKSREFRKLRLKEKAFRDWYSKLAKLRRENNPQYYKNKYKEWVQNNREKRREIDRKWYRRKNLLKSEFMIAVRKTKTEIV